MSNKKSTKGKMPVAFNQIESWILNVRDHKVILDVDLAI